MKVTIEQDDAVFEEEMEEKTFKTGSRGFHAQGKLTVDGKRYQLNVLAIEIGSKLKGESQNE